MKLLLDYKYTISMSYRPVTLVILDGWGENGSSRGNAIRKANLPTIQKLNSFYPFTLLQASGSSVGLPWGEPGNSEVGHITLGTGRIIYQSMPRITLAIQDGSFFSNEALVKASDFAKEHDGALHLMGLIGEGSVHSYIDHLYALFTFAKQQNCPKVFIHAFTDGRDSSPTSGANMLVNVQSRLIDAGIGSIASVCGRQWAMDRNNNWDRIEKAYNMLVLGEGEKIKDPARYLRESYEKGITDEFAEPAVVVGKDNEPIGKIQDGDSVIFFNFREDRARQLTKALALPGFSKFPRKTTPNIQLSTFIEYEKDLPVSVAFSPRSVSRSLGEVISVAGKKQLRMSETEKYAHVTYFFNGGAEAPFAGEDRLMIPSPVVPSFDQAPEMSAEKVTETAIERISAGIYDFVLMNYANADMVGHTGNEEAAVRAVEFLDYCLERLIPVVLKAGGCLLITSDHGNVEEMKDLRTGEKDTEHSTNPVPLWFVTSTNHRQKSSEEIVRQQNEVAGLLSDVAPTVLDLMGLERPPEMFGSSLLPLFSKGGR
jgi:2,3-bisphosphoglycerate-independent phosphoglycerate mutase